MKKVLIFVLVLILISLSTTAFASENLHRYEQALTENSWTISGYSFEKEDHGLLWLVEKECEIRLPNDEINIYENAAGQIFLTCILGEDLSKHLIVIAEIIFNENFSSFVLINNGFAIMYEKNIEE